MQEFDEERANMAYKFDKKRAYMPYGLQMMLIQLQQSNNNLDILQELADFLLVNDRFLGNATSKIGMPCMHKSSLIGAHDLSILQVCMNYLSM